MEFTGERLVPDDPEHRDLYWEHLARYELATRLVRGRRVLDLGCGCGYGADHLAWYGAAEVLGLDNSPAAVAYARAHYRQVNLSFEIAEARCTGLPDASFEAVVCFELIEHLAEQDELLAEIRRVLKPDGYLIISTPDAERPAPAPNPWHVRELSRSAFVALLRRYFPEPILLGQRRFTGVLFAPFVAARTAACELADPAEAAAPPHYWVAISGAPVSAADPRLVEIPYFQNLDELRNHLARRDREVERRDERIAALQREVEEKTTWGQNLDARVAGLARDVQDRDVQLVLREREIAEVRASWGYRLQRKLRPVFRLVKKYAGKIKPAGFFLFRFCFESASLICRTLLHLPRLWPAGRAWSISRKLVKLPVGSPAVDRLPDLSPQTSPLGCTVVIPSYNGRDLLARCLPTVSAAARQCPFPVEILVVDDGGSDDTPAWLNAEHPAVRCIRLPDNRGFGAAANRGVEEARQPIVFLCNNDMELAEDALARVVETLRQTGAFAVACRIRMADEAKAGLETGLVTGRWIGGRLSLTHENDGGRTPRSTLYAGGGSSAFHREAFLTLGGFSPLYRPYYGEDLDLSWRAWKAGYRVLWEPRSEVVHRHRGTIARTASPREVENILARNLLLFVWANLTEADLWRAHCRRLAGEVARGRLPWTVLAAAWRRRKEVSAARLGAGGGVLTDRELLDGAGSAVWDLRRTAAPRPRRGRLKVLAVAPYCPYPPTHGGAVRMWELLTRLAARHEVHLAAMIEREAEFAHRAVLEKHFPRVHLHLRGRPDPAPAWWPVSVAEFRSRAFERAVDRLAGEEDYDLIQAEYPILAHALPYGGRAKTILTEIDVYHVAYRRVMARAAGLSRKLSDAYEWLRMYRYEATYMDRADLLLVMSETDAAACAAVSATPVAVIPNGVDPRRLTFAAPSAEAREVLFVGNFRHPPNLSGVLWFAREIWPLVRRADRRARLTIAGGHPPEEVRRLTHDPTIAVTGLVPDLLPVWRRAAVFVAPILQGSGTRLKILEAMAAGVPVVSTTLGLEGIAAQPGVEALTADCPADFAAACLSCLADANQRTALAGAARTLVEARYNWERIADSLEKTWRELLA